jgi:preprotein translocase subunit YajC
MIGREVKVFILGSFLPLRGVVVSTDDKTLVIRIATGIEKTFKRSQIEKVLFV